MKKKTDIREARETNIGKAKSLSVRYRIDEKGNVCFYNPSCDEMPLTLFCMITEALTNVEKAWNERKEPDIRTLASDSLTIKTQKI
jgi:hypothetical protein